MRSGGVGVGMGVISRNPSKIIGMVGWLSLGAWQIIVP